jgi:primosomal protein N'
MNSCKYCGKGLETPFKICGDCEIAYDAGVRHGENRVRTKLNEVLNALRNLSEVG